MNFVIIYNDGMTKLNNANVETESELKSYGKFGRIAKVELPSEEGLNELVIHAKEMIDAD